MNYEAPSFSKDAFNCPYSACGAYAQQKWYIGLAKSPSSEPPGRVIDKIHAAIDTTSDVKSSSTPRSTELRVSFGGPALGGYPVNGLNFSRCSRCGSVAVWFGSSMLFPPSSSAAPAHEEMPQEVREVYQEASTILSSSPRGAAALVRLALQKLTIHLDQKGDNLNTDIAALVGDGLNSSVIEMLDTVRIFGNNAVHPGEIDLQDDVETAQQLFVLLNFIVDEMISRPNKLKQLHDRIPLGAKEAIERRNEKARKTD